MGATHCLLVVCIWTPRLEIGCYSQSPWSWYAHSRPPLAHALTHYSCPSDTRRPSETQCHPATTVCPKETAYSSCSRAVRQSNEILFRATADTPSRRALLRAQILRQSSKNSNLPPSYYHTISTSLSEAFLKGTYLKDGPRDPNAPAPTPPNPLTDPSAMEGMMDGMKKQMAMNIPQMIIMGWITFFFHGFLVSEFQFRPDR